MDALDNSLTEAAVIDECEYFNDRVWLLMSSTEVKQRVPDGQTVGKGWL